VPPVETSSTPKEARSWAKATRPVLSVTLRRARRMGLRPGERGDLGLVDKLVDKVVDKGWLSWTGRFVRVTASSVTFLLGGDSKGQQHFSGYIGGGAGKEAGCNFRKPQKESAQSMEFRGYVASVLQGN
jgi:hypothetical protein